MDRAIAKAVISLADSIKTALDTINDNLYVPHITQQPVNFTGAIGATATFTVIANNVKGYQWQVKSPGANWADSGSSGNATPTLSLSVTEVRYTYVYRCVITGKDGSVIYTDEVKMVAPET